MSWVKVVKVIKRIESAIFPFALGAGGAMVYSLMENYRVAVYIFLGTVVFFEIFNRFIPNSKSQNM